MLKFLLLEVNNLRDYQLVLQQDKGSQWLNSRPRNSLGRMGQFRLSDGIRLCQSHPADYIPNWQVAPEAFENRPELP